MGARADAIAWAMSMSPGVTYAVPNAFYGARPIYYDDPQYLRARDSARAWLLDPEGYHGLESSFAGWSLTPTRVTVVPWEVPDPWLLPAVATGYSDPDDIVGSWGIVEPDGGLSYDVHRGGYLTPRLPSIGLPSAAMLALSPYQLSDFRVTKPPVTVTPAPGSSAPPATTPTGPAGNPITGNPADQYLVNGTLYDGTGKVLRAPATTTVHAGAAGTLTPLLLAAAVVYVLTRSR